MNVFIHCFSCDEDWAKYNNTANARRKCHFLLAFFCLHSTTHPIKSQFQWCQLLTPCMTATDDDTDDDDDNNDVE